MEGGVKLRPPPALFTTPFAGVAGTHPGHDIDHSGISTTLTLGNVLETIDQDIDRFTMSFIMHREVEGLFR